MHRRWQSVVFALSFLLLLGFVVQLVGTSLRMSVVLALGNRGKRGKSGEVRDYECYNEACNY